MRQWLFFLFVIILFSCNDSRKIPENFDYGKVENGVYKNSFFDFELPIPVGWNVQSREQNDKIGEEGRKIIGEHNKELSEKIKTDEVNSATLLAVFKYRDDTVVKQYNPSFGMIAENLGKFSGSKTAKNYLERAKSLMQQSGIPYHFAPDITTEKLGNKEFALLKLTATYKGNVDVDQLYYCCIEKGFALSLIASFGNDEQRNELLNILSNIRFK
jgi:hypothetical protein